MATISLKITGLGILNALGVGRSNYWQQLLNSAAGIAPIEGFDTAVYSGNLGAEIRNFDARAFMPPRFYRRLSRQSRLAVAASIEAIKDSGLEISEDNRQRIGTVFGTAFGSTEQTNAFYVSLLDEGPQAAEPFLFPDTVPNAPASHVAMYHRLQGPNSTFCQNHLSGECALAYALSLLEQERADAVVVGGVDELSSIMFHSLDAVRALKPLRREEPLRPDRFLSGKGFIPGEGATCMVLERADPASKRQKDSYGTPLSLQLAGAAAPLGHYEANGKALAEAMRTALEEADLQAGDIDIIALGANGVAEFENAEAKALAHVFGSKYRQIPRIAPRYFVGEFGSAGLLAAATILLSLREGMIPPSIRGHDLTGIQGDSHRFAPPEKETMVTGMAIGSTFGGGSACLILAGDLSTY
ncbi:MAG: hypothetical protein HWN68_07800 [Desulfobacterales bacterium]|nr:hypothetical protein [Desulfobacterales bacterium]